MTLPNPNQQPVNEPSKIVIKQEALGISSTNKIRVAIVAVLVVLVCIGGYVLLSQPDSSPPQKVVPPSEPTPSPTSRIFPETTNSPVSPTVPVQSVVVPLLSTDGWKKASNDGVSFLIPPDSSCVPSETDCQRVLYTWYLEGRPVTSTVYVDVQTYKGGSRRAQFLETNNEILNCNPLYVESTFGQVSALQVAVDGGMCQGSSGGIVTVVKGKLMVFRGLSYNSDTKEIPRFEVRDTIISTLR